MKQCLLVLAAAIGLVSACSNSNGGGDSADRRFRPSDLSPFDSLCMQFNQMSPPLGLYAMIDYSLDTLAELGPAQIALLPPLLEIEDLVGDNGLHYFALCQMNLGEHIALLYCVISEVGYRTLIATFDKEGNPIDQIVFNGERFDYCQIDGFLSKELTLTTTQTCYDPHPSETGKLLADQVVLTYQFKNGGFHLADKHGYPGRTMCFSAETRVVDCP